MRFTECKRLNRSIDIAEKLKLSPSDRPQFRRPDCIVTMVGIRLMGTAGSVAGWADAPTRFLMGLSNKYRMRVVTIERISKSARISLQHSQLPRTRYAFPPH